MEDRRRMGKVTSDQHRLFRGRPAVLTVLSILPTKSRGSPSSAAGLLLFAATPLIVSLLLPPIRGSDSRKYHNKGNSSVSPMIVKSYTDAMARKSCSRWKVGKCEVSLYYTAVGRGRIDRGRGSSLL